MYWISFVLMWLIIPIQQGYCVAGEFTFKSKLWASVKSNLKFYAAAGTTLRVGEASSLLD